MIVHTMPGSFTLVCQDCAKTRLLFRECCSLEDNLKNFANESALRPTFRCSDLLEGVSCQTPSDDGANKESVETLGGRTLRPSKEWIDAKRLPERPHKIVVADGLEGSPARVEHSRVFNRLEWSGLVEADPMSQAAHLSTQFEECKPDLIAYKTEDWQRMQSALGDLDSASKRRNKVRRQVQKARGKGPRSRINDQPWAAMGWTQEFLVEFLGFYTTNRAAVVYDAETFQVRAAFLPLQSESPAAGVSLSASRPCCAQELPSQLARCADQVKDAAERFVGRKFPTSKHNFTVLQEGDRGNKSATGPMLMSGVRVVSGIGNINSKDEHGDPCKPGDLNRYRANQSRDTTAERAVAEHAMRFGELEKVLVPRGAECRTKIMETLDPDSAMTLVPPPVGCTSGGRGGAGASSSSASASSSSCATTNRARAYTHRDFNGTHNITKTHSYAVMCHADSSADGTLETILFYRPKTDPMPKKHEDFPAGHKWMFVAGAIFDMPRNRGEGCLIWVASCNPDPLFHGTLPTFTSTAAQNQKQHAMHDGIGSALLCQNNVVAALFKQLLEKCGAQQDCLDFGQGAMAPSSSASGRHGEQSAPQHLPARPEDSDIKRADRWTRNILAGPGVPAPHFGASSNSNDEGFNQAELQRALDESRQLDEKEKQKRKATLVLDEIGNEDDRDHIVPHFGASSNANDEGFNQAELQRALDESRQLHEHGKEKRKALVPDEIGNEDGRQH
eukprot:g10309.t1